MGAARTRLIDRMRVRGGTAEAPQAVGASTYDHGWLMLWGDMIRYSPAPYHRRRLILDVLRRLRFSSLLDVGCGIGEMLMVIAQEHEAELTGVDFSSAVVAQNRLRLPGMSFSVLDIEHGALDKSFDVVVCSEVLEHCCDYESALKNTRAMTKGYLVLTVPGGPRFRIDRTIGHLRHFDERTLTAALEKSGFAVQTMRRWGFPFHPLYKMAINVRPTAMMEAFAGGSYGPMRKAIGLFVRALFYLSVPNRGWQFIVVARAV
jgi:SAM-dependent methyltransferase